MTDNTHGGYSTPDNVTCVIESTNQSKTCKHTNNTMGGHHNISVHSVITSSEEAEANTSILSNIFQGDGADTISECSQNDYSLMISDDDEDGDTEEDDNEDKDDDHEEDDGEENEEDEEDKDHNNAEHSPTNNDNNKEPPTWYEPYIRNEEARHRILRNIVANDRVATSADLPTIAATNTRSIQPKIRNFAQDMIMREITVSLISESWDKEKRNKKFQYEVKRIFEINGLKFISCPRPSRKRGGGAAIIVNTKHFTCEKLNILVPGNLECVWAILRPRFVKKEMQFKEIVLCAFYSPPKSRKNAKLLDHMVSTLHQLLTNTLTVAG